MNVTRIIVLAVSALIAGITMMVVRGALTDKDISLAEARSVSVTQVLVAARNLEIGDSPTSETLEWRDWPDSALHRGFILRANNPDAIQNYENAIVRVNVDAGEPITTSKLVQSGQGGFMSALITQGKLAVSTEIEPSTGAGGFILPNDYVDVIVIKPIETITGSIENISQSILKNVRVLAIDQKYNENKDGDKVLIGSTATLELSPIEAEALAQSNSEGDVSLALRSLTDSGPQRAEQKINEPKTVRNIRIFRYGSVSNVENSQ